MFFVALEPFPKRILSFWALCETLTQTLRPRLQTGALQPFLDAHRSQTLQHRYSDVGALSLKGPTQNASLVRLADGRRSLKSCN